MDNFFLVSSSCMEYFPDNTRAVFKNILPKDYNIENNVLFLNLESVIFSNNYKKFTMEEDGIPDIMCRYHNTYDTFKIPTLTTVKELCNELSSFFSFCAEKRGIRPHGFFELGYYMNKVTLTLIHGDILISDRLKTLLGFQNINF